MGHLFRPALALAVLIIACVSARAGGHLSGDYVEARTASVFAGACHYNGELTTTGRDAALAWHVRDGAWNGVDLAGLSTVAVLTSDANLGDGTAPRRSVLIIDAKATPAQRDALAAALQATCGAALGTVTAVQSAPVTFTRTGETFHVAAKGSVRMDVEAMPDRACCKQPSLVWYQPLVPVADRRVGYTQDSRVNAPLLGAEWAKNGQNTAFYGTFSL